MKFLAFLMAFLILVLSIMPCTDQAVRQAPAHLAINQDHHDHQDYDDHCPPFCSCGCCGVVTMHHATTETNNITFLPYKAQLSFYPSKITKISIPVWQPPQSV